MFDPNAIADLLQALEGVKKFLPVIQAVLENLPPIDVKPITLTEKGVKKDYIAILIEKPKDKPKSPQT